MRSMRILPVLIAAAACLSIGQAAPDMREPSIGYLYAAGGRQGTTVTITAGGQNLRGVKQVFITGEGVTAKVVKFGRGGRLAIKNEQLQELRRRLSRISRRKIAELAAQGRESRRDRPRARRRNPPKAAPKPDAKQEPVVELPDHPLLKDLEKYSLRELKKVADLFFDPTRRLQASAQIAERVVVEVTIAADAPPGERAFRLGTPRGLSNPLPFMVGTVPELNESEINDFEPMSLPPVRTPIVVNGQIDVKDVDRFRFHARKGQNLVIEAQARRLVPFLADAVPGWFQAVMTLRDASGEEVGFFDDFRFHPDPVVCLPVTEDGEYELEIRDSIHRGREDFVYRITIGETPFVTGMFPLGGREGEETAAKITGWNLDESSVPLDTRPGAGGVREASWLMGSGFSNCVSYAVDGLPEAAEVEPNNTRGGAQPVALPRIINGRIGKAGDVDAFRFEAKAGDQVAAEVWARRLDSPLDSLVRITDARGTVVAWNDDRKVTGWGFVRGTGLQTHYADSCLLATLPADGTYIVQLTDTRGHGGDEYAYRLRVTPPQPDFKVIVTPSCLNMPSGARVPFYVHAQRRDGFDGEIEVVLKDAPKGFSLDGGRIPAGRNRVRMTLSAPGARRGRPVPLTLVASAKVGEQVVTRTAIAADNRMQAFLWRHLVPAEQMMVFVGGGRGRSTPVRYAGRGPAQVKAGGTTHVRLSAPGLPDISRIRFELSEPPPGLSLRDVGKTKNGVLVVLQADPEKAEVGYADNLIVEVYMEYEVRNREGKKTGQKRRTFIGVLPAIPYVIVST